MYMPGKVKNQKKKNKRKKRRENAHLVLLCPTSQGLHECHQDLDLNKIQLNTVSKTGEWILKQENMS